jgi:hypothetical protein
LDRLLVLVREAVTNALFADRDVLQLRAQRMRDEERRRCTSCACTTLATVSRSSRNFVEHVDADRG